MGYLDADVVSRVREAVGRSLDRTGVPRSAEPLVVAVSGGADSICLLDAVVAVLPDAERRIVVGHVDHRLRPESGADADFVRSIAASYGLACEIMTVDVRGLALLEHRGIEEAARLARYRALRDARLRPGIPEVVTGHTRDDSVETVIMHLLRGSGRRGLGGIAESELLHPAALGEPAGSSLTGSLRVARPLLDVSRADTAQYCEARGIRWLLDETNADPRFFRNRVRHHLLPVLRTYNPGIESAITRLAQVMRDEDRFLDEAVSLRSRHLVQWASDHMSVGLDEWRRLPVALQRRLVRSIASDAGFAEIGFEAVERALAVGGEAGPPRAELGGGLTVERTADLLIFRSHGPGEGTS